MKRRSFLASCTSVVAGAAAAGVAPRLLASDRVDLSSPTAVALGYVHNAEEADTERYGDRAVLARAGENICQNCRFFPVEDGPEWQPCPLFAGQDVSARGWCSAYVQR